jgi:hypothetical protein
MWMQFSTADSENDNFMRSLVLVSHSKIRVVLLNENIAMKFSPILCLALTLLIASATSNVSNTLLVSKDAGRWGDGMMECVREIPKCIQRTNMLTWF